MFNIIPNRGARPTVLVAVAGQSSTSTGMRSRDNGFTWSVITYPASVEWRNIGYGGGRFVGIGGANNSMISIDGGLNFIAGGTLPAIAHPGTPVWTHLAYSPSRDRWLAACTNATNNVMASSDDGGESWQAQTYPATLGTQNGSITYLEGLDRFMYPINGRMYTSDDGGENWTDRGASSGMISGSAFMTGGAVTTVGLDEYVCYVGDQSVNPFSAYSLTGAAFTNGTTVGAAGGWGKICGRNGQFIATVQNDDNGNHIASSVDGGDNWDISIVTDHGVFWTVTGTQYGFVGLASTVFPGSNRTMTSPDGINWTLAESAAATAQWTQVASTFEQD